jgi:hypothetical protein
VEAGARLGGALVWSVSVTVVTRTLALDIKDTESIDVVVHTCNLSTRETEAGGL